jgi:hypothetical protein
VPLAETQVPLAWPQSIDGAFETARQLAQPENWGKVLEQAQATWAELQHGFEQAYAKEQTAWLEEQRRQAFEPWKQAAALGSFPLPSRLVSAAGAHMSAIPPDGTTTTTTTFAGSVSIRNDATVRVGGVVKLQEDVERAE